MGVGESRSGGGHLDGMSPLGNPGGRGLRRGGAFASSRGSVLLERSRWGAARWSAWRQGWEKRRAFAYPVSKEATWVSHAHPPPFSPLRCERRYASLVEPTSLRVLFMGIDVRSFAGRQDPTAFRRTLSPRYPGLEDGVSRCVVVLPFRTWGLSNRPLPSFFSLFHSHKCRGLLEYLVSLQLLHLGQRVEKAGFCRPWTPMERELLFSCC